MKQQGFALAIEESGPSIHVSISVNGESIWNENGPNTAVRVVHPVMTESELEEFAEKWSIVDPRLNKIQHLARYVSGNTRTVEKEIVEIRRSLKRITRAVECTRNALEVMSKLDKKDG